MGSFESQVIGKGRITIPKQVREELEIKEGDFVRVEGLTKLRLVEEKNPKEEAPPS